MKMVVDVDLKAIEQNNFIGNLEQTRNTAMFLILIKVKRNYFGFFTRIFELIFKLFFLVIISIQNDLI